MNPPRGSEPVADLTLERYLLNELPAGEMARMRERLERDETLRRRLDDLRRADELLARDFPAERLAEQVRARLRDGSSATARGAAETAGGATATGSGATGSAAIGSASTGSAATAFASTASVATAFASTGSASTRPARRRGPLAWMRPWPIAAAAAVAVALLLVVILPRTTGPGSGAPARRMSAVQASGNRIKGLAPSLKLFRKTAEGSEALADSALASPGDLIRVGYAAAGRPWGAILSIDGRGALTVHFPAGGLQAAALRSGETVLLDSAFKLDDAPRWERFYLITADAPFEIAAVLGAARRAAARSAPPDSLPLPSGLHQCVFSLRKGSQG